MFKPTKHFIPVLLMVLAIIIDSIPVTSATLSIMDKKVYLPYVITEPPTTRKINIPYFGQDDIRSLHYGEMAIFWFGKIAPPENYSDVRIAYNDSGLAISLSIFDRRLWYDKTPSPTDLDRWDAVTLYLSKSEVFDGNTYRFTSQLNDWEPRQNWQLSEKGSSSGWIPGAITFSTTTGVRWEDDPGGFNNNSNNRGSVIHYSIPFTSFGLTSKPAQGTVWKMALVMHDRDSEDETTFIETFWPENMQTNQPRTWGRLEFGMPSYSPPPILTAGTITVRDQRNQPNGTVVPDAALGGTTGNLCPDNYDYIWYQWPNTNFGFAKDMNIQNQSDLVDWPCFSKYYIKFPLSSIPTNKIILNATMTLFHWGNSGALSGSNLAQPSYIHVFSVNEDWSEGTITWNNAPLVQENVSVARVDPAPPCGGPGELTWPCTPRSWDLTRAAVEAYQKGKPLNLAIYSSDSPYHSGKFFTTSDADDWNATGRPMLVITWGNP